MHETDNLTQRRMDRAVKEPRSRINLDSQCRPDAISKSACQIQRKEQRDFVEVSVRHRSTAQTGRKRMESSMERNSSPLHNKGGRKENAV